MNELKKHDPASDSFLCADRAASLIIAFPSYSLIWSDGYSLKVFWRRAYKDLIDDWFGCRYIFLQNPIGEITGFKCRLLLSAVPVHYLKKKINVEECRALRGIDTLYIPTISLYYTGSYLHDLEVQEERSFHHKWSWCEHLRGSNMPFPLIISSFERGYKDKIFIFAMYIVYVNTTNVSIVHCLLWYFSHWSRFLLKDVKQM